MRDELERLVEESTPQMSRLGENKMKQSVLTSVENERDSGMNAHINSKMNEAMNGSSNGYTNAEVDSTMLRNSNGYTNAVVDSKMLKSMSSDAVLQTAL